MSLTTLFCVSSIEYVLKVIDLQKKLEFPFKVLEISTKESTRYVRSHREFFQSIFDLETAEIMQFVYCTEARWGHLHTPLKAEPIRIMQSL